MPDRESPIRCLCHPQDTGDDSGIIIDSCRGLQKFICLTDTSSFDYIWSIGSFLILFPVFESQNRPRCISVGTDISLPDGTYFHSVRATALWR